MVEFEEDGKIKSKIYPSDCIVEGSNQLLIILISHDECVFSANNVIRKA